LRWGTEQLLDQRRGRENDGVEVAFMEW
jgi:hypothetical protein